METQALEEALDKCGQIYDNKEDVVELVKIFTELSEPRRKAVIDFAHSFDTSQN